jgi:putative polyketide hydroxylase
MSLGSATRAVVSATTNKTFWRRPVARSLARPPPRTASAKPASSRDSADWAALYGVDPGGAVLVRPDGHVAWCIRSNSTEAEALMRTVLRTVVRR